MIRIYCNEDFCVCVTRNVHFLADAVHNAMGIGFNGYDHDGQPKWNSVTNVNIFQIEVKGVCLN